VPTAAPRHCSQSDSAELPQELSAVADVLRAPVPLPQHNGSERQPVQLASEER